MDRPDGEREPRQRNKLWFDHMEGYLAWKIAGPDIRNPFKSGFPVNVLKRMATQREFLMQFVQVRCLCDGYEVMIMSNPSHPRLQTNHPTIARIKLDDIVAYMEIAGIADQITREVDKIQADIQEYIKEREKEGLDAFTASMPREKTKPGDRKKDQGKRQNQGFRIIKR